MEGIEFFLGVLIVFCCMMWELDLDLGLVCFYLFSWAIFLLMKIISQTFILAYLAYILL
jgi:hypothetical protein